MGSRTLNFSLLLDWAGDGNFSSDESNYFLTADGNEEMANPSESVFASSGFAGEMNVSVLNPGRRFSPSASPLIASGGLREYLQNGNFYGKRIRLYITISGVQSLLFQGAIKEIEENPRTTSTVGTVSFRCTTEDSFVINRRLNSLVGDTQTFFDTGKDEGELIAKTLSLAGLTDGVHFVSQAYGGAGAKTIDRGMFTIPWYWLDGDSPIEDCWRLAASCGGRFFFNPADGKYYYKNAQFLGFDVSATSQETISESNTDRIEPIYKDKELYKSIKITIRPRRIGEKTVLWEPDEIIKILPGQTIILSAKLSTPVYSFTKLDMIAQNTGGFNITENLSVSATYYSQSVQFSLTNNSIYHMFLRKFELIGRPIEGGEQTTFDGVPLNTSFWSGRNGKERKISDNPYIQTLAQAEAIGTLLAHRQGYFNEEVSVEGYRGTKVLRPAWRVTVNNSSLSFSKDVIITSVKWRLDSAGFTQDFNGISAATIYHYDNSEYFVVNTHSGSSGKRYFY